MAAEQPKWKTLESNPDVINQFMHSLGVPSVWKFGDCFGLDTDALQFVPRPCIAMMFLFPTNSVGENKENSDVIQKDKPSDSIYFVKQLVDNACGTIAVVHAVANNLSKISLEDKALKKFIEQTKNKSPFERGQMLGFDSGIADAHQSSSEKGQTKPDDVMQDDFHFICFTEIDGSLYQLDGGKPAPINHGPTTADKFVEDTAKIIQKNFIEKTKDLFFSVLTLGPAQD